MTSAAGYSIIDEIVDGGTPELRGEGTLRLQEGQDGPPAGPGIVRFLLRYASGVDGERHTPAIKLSLEAVDEGGREILDWVPDVERAPLPQYDLTGTIEAGGETTPVTMEPVLVDHTLPATMHSMFSHDITWKVCAGSGLGEETTSARAIVPNLAAPEVDTLTAGLRLRLENIYPDAERALGDPANAGRMLPTCVLHVEKARDKQGVDVTEALEVLGWLLSFYAGGAVHPNAWECDTARGRVWCLKAHDVRRLPIDANRTCLQQDGLEPFLRRGHENWRNLDET
jgi:hypothetical protein